MNKQNCCFTGHRDIPLESQEEIINSLYETLEFLINNLKVCNFFAGGALGFDTISALLILKLKEKYPHITLNLILPCRDQFKSWNLNDVRIYQDILKKADSAEFISEKYTLGCMQKRNKALVDNSAFCVSYLTKQSGGTHFTVNYAKKKGLFLINIEA